MPPRDPVRSFTDAVSEACGAAVELTRPSDERHGDYATNVALQLAGTLRRPPREVAEELRERIAALDGVAGVEVAGPGFLTLTVDDRWLTGGLAAVLEAGAGFGGAVADEPERIQVELVSANPTGPITVCFARPSAATSGRSRS